MMRNGEMKSVKFLWIFRQEPRFWKGIMTCQFPVKRLDPTHDGIGYASPPVHLYWKAEGNDKWILLRCDADYLFNSNYTGSYIWDETTNYVTVIPQSWH